MHDLVKNLPEPMVPKQERTATPERLILCSMRQAFFYARKCCRRSIPDDEIFSICYRALLAASKNFKEGRTSSFFAFSKAYIRGALSRSWSEKELVPHTSRRMLSRVDDFHPKNEYDYDGTSKEPSFPKELVVEPDFPAIHSKEMRTLLLKALNSPLLADYHRRVLVLRYYRHMTFVEIARELRCSKQNAQALEAKALEILRRFVSPNLFKQ